MKALRKRWKTARLGDCVTFQTGKLNSNAAKPDGAFPFFTCSQETFKTDTYSFDAECVLLAGNNANAIYPLKYFKGKFDAYQRTYVIRSIDSEILDNRFLYYSLFPQLEHLQSISTGSATKFLTLTILKEVTIDVSAIDVQRRIASILSVYDDLIENNTRRIKILEEMAQMLYREWFVNFRFPGHENVLLVESELGPIPEEWSVRSLRDVTSFIGRGISPTYDDCADGWVINQKCIRGRRLSLGPARKQSRSVPLDKAVRKGDILINSTGVGTLGRVAQVHLELVNFTVDSHVSIIRPTRHADFLGEVALQLEPDFEAMGVGSTGQTELGRERIASTLFICPTDSLQAAFSEHAARLHQLMLCLSRQNENLCTTRDFLLPKLISGEIPVEAADEAATELAPQSA